MAQMIIDQYEPTDQMFSVASRLKDEATVKIEQQRDKMVIKFISYTFYLIISFKYRKNIMQKTFINQLKDIWPNTKLLKKELLKEIQD